MRVMVGGVGYPLLSDMSAGLAVLAALRRLSWPEWVELEDLSYSPIGVRHRLCEASPPFGRLVVVTAARRGDPPGSVRLRWWDGRLPPVDEIQARVAEAVTGVISADNLLVVLGAFGALPREVATVEVEPLLETWGEILSRPVLAALPRAAALARRAALGGALAGMGPEEAGGWTAGRPPTNSWTN